MKFKLMEMTKAELKTKLKDEGVGKLSKGEKSLFDNYYQEWRDENKKKRDDQLTYNKFVKHFLGVE